MHIFALKTTNQGQKSLEVERFVVVCPWMKIKMDTALTVGNTQDELCSFKKIQTAWLYTGV